MSTPVTNFAKGVVSSIGYSAGATSIDLITGHGSRFPSTFPYPATWWNSTDYPDPADDPDKEIVSVTALAGDTFTITRAQEGTVASNKNTPGKTYKFVAGITAAMWTSIFSQSLSQSFRNLTVQNHYDSNQKRQAVIFSADSIVMNDGQEISDWSNVEADLTVSGAGGLDTGAEAASTTYELWAISDGGTNKSAVLHRAKSYLLDQDGSAGEDGAHALLRVTAPLNERLAQGFKMATPGPLEFVDIKLLKTGAPTGNYWLTLESDSGGAPSGTVLATSQKFDASLLTTTATWVRMPFRTPYSVSVATQYHLVLRGDYTLSDTNNISWRADTTAAAYANGNANYYNGSWTPDADDDFMFKAYVTVNDTAVTLPTGYTQQALLCPFIYNNASSNLHLFMQVNKTIQCHAAEASTISANDDWIIFAAGSGPVAHTLYHISWLTPARPCTVHVAFGNTSGAVAAQFGHITATWLNSAASIGSGPGALTGAYVPVATANGNAYSAERAVLIEYQGLNALTGGANTFARINRIEW